MNDKFVIVLVVFILKLFFLLCHIFKEQRKVFERGSENRRFVRPRIVPVVPERPIVSNSESNQFVISINETEKQCDQPPSYSNFLPPSYSEVMKVQN